ncbi:MAG: hypothetical protein V1799_01730 [bacterium]
MKKQKELKLLPMLWLLLLAIFFTEVAIELTTDHVSRYIYQMRSVSFLKTNAAQNVVAGVLMFMGFLHLVQFLLNLIRKTVGFTASSKRIIQFLHRKDDTQLSWREVAGHVCIAVCCFIFAIKFLRHHIIRVFTIHYWINIPIPILFEPAMYGVIAVLLWLFLIRGILLRFFSRIRYPMFIQVLFLWGLKEWREWIGERLVKRVGSLTVRLFLCSLGILIFVEFLNTLGVFRELDNVIVQMNIGGKRNKAADAPVVTVLRLETKDGDVQNYLSCCLAIVKNLKEVGTKAVFVDYRYALYANSKVMIDYGRKFEDQDIAVLGVSSLPYSRRNQYVEPDSLFFKSALFSRTFSPAIRGSGFTHMFFETDNPHSDYAILHLIEKFRGYPADLQTVQTMDGIQYGNDLIPLSRHAGFLIKQGANWQDSEIHAFSTDDGDVRFPHRHQLIGYSIYSTITIDMFSRKLSQLGDRYLNDFKGKVVFIVWSNPESWTYGESSSSMSIHADALANILGKRFLVEAPWLHLPLSIIFLLTSMFLTKAFPVRFSLLMLMIITISALYFNAWLFQVNDIVTDAASLVLTMVLATAILPAVRLAFDIREKQKLAGRDK